MALRQLHNNTVQSGESHTAGKRNKQLVSTSYNIAPAQLAQQQMVVGAHNSHSYAAMRLSQQAFSGGNVGGAGGGYANQALNQSMGLPL